ncbi:MAG: hypothetical protein ACK6EB_39860, partial [Planctomyces sp.]
CTVTSIRLGIGFLRRAQICEGILAGGMPRAISRLEYVTADSREDFPRRSAEVRFDYVQHSCCAILNYFGAVLSYNPSINRTAC